jgi:hypothetical protein
MYDELAFSNKEIKVLRKALSLKSRCYASLAMMLISIVWIAIFRPLFGEVHTGWVIILAIVDILSIIIFFWGFFSDMIASYKYDKLEKRHPEFLDIERLEKNEKI